LSRITFGFQKASGSASRAALGFSIFLQAQLESHYRPLSLATCQAKLHVPHSFDSIGIGGPFSFNSFRSYWMDEQATIKDAPENARR